MPIQLTVRIDRFFDETSKALIFLNHMIFINLRHSPCYGEPERVRELLGPLSYLSRDYASAGVFKYDELRGHVFWRT